MTDEEIADEYPVFWACRLAAGALESDPTPDPRDAEIERLRRRLKATAYVSPVGAKMPMILEVVAADGQHWEECSNCRDELTSYSHDAGTALECGQCGARWWEGELDDDSLPTKDSDDPDPPCDRCGDVCCGCYADEAESEQESDDCSHDNLVTCIDGIYCPDCGETFEDNTGSNLLGG